MKKKLLLCILDGMGIGKKSKWNAFDNANKPNYDYLWNNYPHSLLNASGEDVGLPHGQMGNSEVGHSNIGAGRIIYQSLELINKSISKGEFYSNEKMIDVFNHVKNNNSKLHIMGLLSDGGIHSHINHLMGLFEACKKNNISEVYFHFFLDGRDTNIGTGIKFLDVVNEKIKEYGFGVISTISGRYYGMDRDNRFDRVKKYYDVITLGKGEEYNNYSDCFYSNIKRDITDEFVIPAVIDKGGLIEDNDGVIVFNYRPDRLREICAALTNPNFLCFERKILSNLKLVTMMPISDDSLSKSMFSHSKLDNTMGEYLDKIGLSQLRIAETEKYAHVTYFFDGGVERELNHAKRILIDSPKVATYDLKPEMSAYEVTDALIEEINKNGEDVIILNFANGDMVGHTGNYEAAKRAVEVVDECLGKIINNIDNKLYTIIVTADHGNCEVMKNDEMSINTSHSTNKVPFIVTDKNILLNDGKLGDVAPTMLELLEIVKPNDMTGNSLINVIK